MNEGKLMKPFIISHMTKNRVGTVFLVLLLLLSVISGCDGNNDHAFDKSGSDTGSLSFSISWNQSLTAQSDYHPMAVVCGAENSRVATVSAAIAKSQTDVFRFGGPWECDASLGTISNVPVDSGYTLFIYGHNGQEQTTYSGVELDIAVSAGSNNLGTIDADEFFTEMISPADGTSDIDPDNATFTWNSATGAPMYQLWISESDDFSNPMIFETSNLAYTVPSGNLNANTTYYWKVYCIDIYSNRSFFIWNNFSFTTGSDTVSDAPNLIGWQYWGNSSFSVDPDWLVWGQGLDINWAITNNGSGAIPAGTDVFVRFYLSEDTVFNSNDVELNPLGYLDPIFNFGLNAGAGLFGTFTITSLPASSPFFSDAGYFYIGMVIDVTDAVAESNEEDNSGVGLMIDYYQVYIEPFF